MTRRSQGASGARARRKAQTRPSAVGGPPGRASIAETWFVIGTDTGVGKTVLAAWLTRGVRARGLRVRAVKPLASGGREDARALREAEGSGRHLDAINPWWFRAALTPMVAARRAGRTVGFVEVERFLEEARADCDVLVVEGAGGLRSPLGEGWDALDLIRSLDAIPVLVAANRLGVLNAVRLTMDALPGRRAGRCRIALMDPPRPGLAAQTNAGVLEAWYGRERVVRFPWIAGGSALAGPLTQRVRSALARLMEPGRGGA